MEHQSEFAAAALDILGQPASQGIAGQGVHLLELLGQFTTDGQGTFTQGRKRLCQIGHSVRRFQQHHRAGLLPERLDRRRSLSCLGR